MASTPFMWTMSYQRQGKQTLIKCEPIKIKIHAKHNIAGIEGIKIVIFVNFEKLINSRVKNGYLSSTWQNDYYQY